MVNKRVGSMSPCVSRVIIVGQVLYTVLAGWYCCASEAGQSTEGHVSRVTSPNRARAL